METILTIPLWLFKPKHLVKLSSWLHDSPAGKNTFKVVITVLFFSLIYISYSVAELTLLKNGLTLKGIHISFAVFMDLAPLQQDISISLLKICSFLKTTIKTNLLR